MFPLYLDLADANQRLNRVGVGGHSLHGGFGFSSHTYGLAVDWIASATVVLANATVVTASPTENPDLFWALRGAGSNFGIVASFKFNTFAAPNQVTAFQINLPWQSASAIASGWGKLQDWLAAGNMPKEMNFRIFGSPSQTQIQGLYHGSSSALRTAAQPLLTALGASLSNAQQYDWMGAFTYYTYGSAGQVDVTHPYNQVSSSFLLLFPPPFHSQIVSLIHMPGRNLLLQIPRHHRPPSSRSQVRRRLLD